MVGCFARSGMSFLRCRAKHPRFYSPPSSLLLRQGACAPSSPSSSCQQWRPYLSQQPQADSIRSFANTQKPIVVPSPSPFGWSVLAPIRYAHARARRRTFSTSPTPRHGNLEPPKPGEERHVTFIDKEGASHTFAVADGDNLLDIAQANDLEMEGACGGSCACSTCHVIVSSEDFYNKMDEPSDDENDMLDLAFGLTETSRLGCQIKMGPALDGLEVKLPSMTRNMQASDFQKK